MRLVDADKVITTRDDCEKTTTLEKRFRGLLSNQPTVEAIPIKWLEKVAYVYRISSFYTRQSNKKEADRQDLIEEIVELIIKWWEEGRWREENEID